MRTFNYHHDAGHGWLAVKIELLHFLGIIDQVTSYSYIRGKTAYLEEDHDATMFARFYRSRIGNFEEKASYTDKSPIRSYKSYTPELARTIINKNK